MLRLFTLTRLVLSFLLLNTIVNKISYLMQDDSNMIDNDESLYKVGSELSTPKVVMGSLNGMIGGTILVLPILGLSAGWITSIIVCSVFGFINYYTLYLSVLHFGRRNLR